MPHRHAHATGFGALLFGALALTVASFMPSAADAQISREDARQVVLNNVLVGTPAESLSFAHLYLATGVDSIVPAGETLQSQDFNSPLDYTIVSDSYLILIDDNPVARWEHPCRYVLVDANTSSFQVFNAETPFYLVNADTSAYVSWDDRWNPDELFSGNPAIYEEDQPVPPPAPSFAIRALSQIAKPGVFDYQAFAAGDTCGLIIQGNEGPRDGGAIDSASAADTRRMTRIMQSQGVTAIKVIKPTTGKALAESIKANAAGKKKFWLYYTGHGWRDKTNNTGQGGPWVPTDPDSAGKVPTWKALACSLEAANPSEVCVVVDACYAGRAVPAFQMKNLNGVVVTSSHPDSTSIACVWRFVSDNRLARAQSKYTTALDSCFMNAASDSSMPPNGVDLLEAHRWARKDAKVTPQRAPHAGLLFDLSWLHAGTLQIPDFLINSNLYTPFGMASDPANNLIHINFQVINPTPSDTMITLQIFPDLIFPNFFPCIQQSPPNTGQTLDLALPTFWPPNFYMHSSPFFNEMLEVNGCTVQQPWAFSTIYGGIAGDPDQPLLHAYDVGSAQFFGPPYLLTPFDIAGGPGNPPIALPFDVELVPQPLPGDPLLILNDFALLPLAPYPLDPLVGGIGLPIPPSPIQGLELYTQALVDPAEPIQNRRLSLGRLDMPEVTEPRGVAVLPAQAGGGGALGTSGGTPDAAYVYVIDGDPAPGGGYRVEVYLLGNILPSSGTVSIPGPGGPVVLNEVQLAQSRPNPALGPTTIGFSLPLDSQNATLAIYDLAGRRVRTLVDGALSAGEHSRTWDGRDDRGNRIDAGVFFYRLDVEQGGETVSASRRLVRIR